MSNDLSGGLVNLLTNARQVLISDGTEAVFDVFSDIENVGLKIYVDKSQTKMAPELNEKIHQQKESMKKSKQYVLRLMGYIRKYAISVVSIKNIKFNF